MARLARLAGHLISPRGCAADIKPSANRANRANRHQEGLSMDTQQSDECQAAPNGKGAGFMEEWLSDASEDECLAWAQTDEQVELVRRVRRYPAVWALRIIRNSKWWAKIFAERDAVSLSGVSLLKLKQDPEGAIVEAALRIFRGTLRTCTDTRPAKEESTDTRPANEESAEGVVECELPGV